MVSVSRMASSSACAPGVEIAFGRGHEARAHLDALGSQRECSEQAARIADAAGGEHRDFDGVDHHRHQRQRCDSADVPAGLGAGGDDGVDALGLHAPRVLDSRDHRDDLDAGAP